MKRIAIIHSVAGNSAKVLANAFNTRTHGEFQADVYRPYKDGVRDLSHYDYTFSYGCSATTRDRKRYNASRPVKHCVDKPSTFRCLQAAGVSTVNFVEKKEDVPKNWATVVVRKEKDGRKAENMEYVYQYLDQPLIDGELFTEYFEHKYEYRIMVFMGKVVGRYYKREEKGDWYFELQPKKGFEKMDLQCIKAAKALGIDYVGFDVVANTKNDFAILEANSACRITDEAETAILEHFLNLE